MVLKKNCVYLSNREPAKDVGSSKPVPSGDLNLQSPDQFTVVTEFDFAEYACQPGKYFGNMESVFRLQYTGSYDAASLPK